jgi:hypothetical protein
MERDDADELEAEASDEWGPQMAIPGYLVEPGQEQYHHRVGGISWQAVDPRSAALPPLVLLILDLRDPRLASLHMEGVEELPFALHVNCEWPERQVYRIEPETRTVRLIYPDTGQPMPLLPAIPFPNPFPETRVHLRDMTAADWPLDWGSLSRLQGEFKSGPHFLRVLGPPIWIEEEMNPTCSCGAPMLCVGGIGAEAEWNNYVPGDLLYFGNGAFYLFLCRRCREVLVMFQCT